MPDITTSLETDARFTSAVAQVASEATARHARWDAGVFSAMTDGPARSLWSRICREPRAEAVLAGFLTLLKEAVVAGYVRRAAPPAASRCESFLEYCLLRAIPEQLADVSAESRLSLLANIWNLGEGLLRETPWMGRYVASRAAEMERLEDVEAFLARILEPVLEPALPAGWSGPFEVTMIDLRPAVDDLLPGKMHLAAPSLLSVADRGRADTHVTVLGERRDFFYPPRGFFGLIVMS